MTQLALALDVDDLLRDTLNAHALAAMNAASLTCAYVARPFSLKTNEIVGEFQFRTGTPKAAITPGILQFTIYAPEAVEADQVMKIANSLKDAFDRKRWKVSDGAHVEIEETKAFVLTRVRDGKRIAIVDAGFDYTRESALNLPRAIR